ncbi:Proline porter II [Piscirickettsia salmonis]|uniref:MFS transporter n=1 Tax=Piscirickettsia salmonis TaxID=1238 RepID=UPI0012B8034B|nr:MFS transporter [Piscirickettsia salmonis]QGP48985.1 Proline porter II [Piscirickettsia salmonis]
MNAIKTNLATTGGNALEWYDYSIYGQLTPIIAILFFPTKDPLTSLLFAFSAYFLSFALRPIGGIVLGRIGDHHGRKKVLLLSVSIMTISTFCIALLPTYSQTGIIAPILFILLRLIQGLAISAEFTCSTSYQIERKSNKKSYLGALVQSTTLIGSLFAALIVSLLSFLLPHDQLVSWGWRVPFLISGFCGIYLIKLRSKLPEPDEFNKINEKEKKLKNKKNYIFNNKKIIFLSFFIPAGATAGIYFFIYQISYMTTFIHADLFKATFINAIATLLIALLIPIIAKAGDRYDIQKVLYVGLGLLIVTTLPLFWLMSQQSLVMIIAGQLLFVTVLSPYLGLNAVFMASLYPTHIRITVFSFVYNLAVAIFGSSIPLVAIYLHEKSHFKFASGIYFMAMCLMSLIALILLGKYKSTTNKHLSSQAAHPASRSQLA